MRDNDKGIVGHAGHLRHNFRSFGKPIGNDRGGGEASFFGGDSVMQTARRAAPSIAYR